MELMRASPYGSRGAMSGMANAKRQLIVADITQN
jgi:hypothetical protein